MFRWDSYSVCGSWVLFAPTNRPEDQIQYSAASPRPLCSSRFVGTWSSNSGIQKPWWGLCMGSTAVLKPSPTLSKPLMHQKKADLKPKSSAQGTRSVILSSKEEQTSPWEELTMFHSSWIKQSSSNRVPTPLSTPARNRRVLSCFSLGQWCPNPCSASPR